MKNAVWMCFAVAAVLLGAGACARRSEMPAAGDAADAPAAAPAVAADGAGVVEAPVWLDDFAAAQAKARELQRPILADFTGSDWCIWCMRLKQEVFSQAAFQQYAAKQLVLFEADFPQSKILTPKVKEQNDQLAKKYEIQGFPTILLLDADGKVLGKTGYQPGGAEAYVEHLKQLAAGKPAAMQP